MGGPREGYGYVPSSITRQTHLFLGNVGLLKFYEKVTSLRGDMCLLFQFIHHWDHDRYAFRAGLICFSNPQKRPFILLASCLEGVIICSNYLIYQLRFQERVSWHMFIDIPMHISLTLVTFKLVASFICTHSWYMWLGAYCFWS